MEISDSENSDNEPMTPPELSKETEELIEVDTKHKHNVIPEYSRKKYFRVYDVFKEWQKSHNHDKVTESVMIAYFEKLNETKKPSTLWGQYSMLKSTLINKEDIDISQFKKMRAYLRKQNTGIKKVKSSKVLTATNIHDFLLKASDYEFLSEKVILILGVVGACKRSEIVDLTMSDIVDTGTILVVTIHGTPKRQMRKFTIDGDFYKIVKKYMNLRPKNTKLNRLLLNYQKGKCTHQPIGVNKVGGVPRRVASYLELPDADEYTGHCFSRTSRDLLSQSKANVVNVVGELKAIKSSGQVDKPLQIYNQMEASTILKTCLSDTQQQNNQTIVNQDPVSSQQFQINQGQSINSVREFNNNQEQMYDNQESAMKTLNLDGFKFAVVEIDRRVEVVQKGWSPPEGAEYVKPHAIFDSYKSASDYAETLNVKGTPRMTKVVPEVIFIDDDSSNCPRTKAEKVVNSVLSSKPSKIVKKKITLTPTYTTSENSNSKNSKKVIGTLINKNAGQSIQITSVSGANEVIKSKRFIGALVNKNVKQSSMIENSGGTQNITGVSNMQNLNSRNVKSGPVFVVEIANDSSNVITSDVTHNSNSLMQIDTGDPTLRSSSLDLNALKEPAIKEEFIDEEFIIDDEFMMIDPLAI